MAKFKIGIIGASGYTASELTRLAVTHPEIEIAFLVGNSKAGEELQQSYPHFKFYDLPVIAKIGEVNFNDINAVFSCLPHGETAKIISQIPKNIKILDLSSDFRIKDAKLYQEFYAAELNQDFTGDIAYGLSEIYTTEIKQKRIIACPGCYPTSILLPLIPLKEQLDLSEIIIDSKTGVSGAGRKVAEDFLFCELNENVAPYNLTKHRHLSELIENLGVSKNNLQFTPQIIPTSRGIYSNIYVKSEYSATELTKQLSSFYADKYFIRVNQNGEIPKLRNVVGTNFAEITIVDSNIANQKIILCAIDNLTKGSSGQALQNFNLCFDLPETLGLTNCAIYP